MSEKEYIEREALKKKIAELKVAGTFTEFFKNVTMKIISEEPTANVQEVVRCKDCQYFDEATVNEKGFLICPASEMEITEYDFCSYGAKMDKE